MGGGNGKRGGNGGEEAEWAEVEMRGGNGIKMEMEWGRKFGGGGGICFIMLQCRFFLAAKEER